MRKGQAHPCVATSGSWDGQQKEEAETGQNSGPELSGGLGSEAGVGG